MNKHIAKEQGNTPIEPSPRTCGLIMPISALDGCSAEHWSEVKAIIAESIETISEPSFSVKLVSEAEDIGVIQKRIVQNIYNSDVVVCDVSGKNPNVMFELGMRLAFDKPTVIIKDDKTDYSFDTGIIEHVAYPRDLRFGRMVTFKSILAEKVLATHRAALASPEHSTFLKNFGKFHVANLSQDVVPADKLVVEMISDIHGELSRLRRQISRERAETRPSDKAAAKLASALISYALENPSSDLASLMGNEKFYEEMEERCDARHHFSTRQEYLGALEKTLEEMSQKARTIIRRTIRAHSES